MHFEAKCEKILEGWGVLEKDLGYQAEGSQGPQATANYQLERGYVSIFTSCTCFICCLSELYTLPIYIFTASTTQGCAVLDSRRWHHLLGNEYGKKRGTRRTGASQDWGRVWPPPSCPQMWMSAAPGGISATTPPSASTLWVHTGATAAEAGSLNLDSRISKGTPSVKVPILPWSKTHPQQTQTLPHLMSCSPVPCRDLLPHLDCSLWNQEPGEWPQRDRQQEISPQSPFISPKLPDSHEALWPPCLLP